MMDVLATILSSSRTVFTPQWLAMTDSTRDKESLSRSLRYYARTGALRNPRGGIYTKPVYDEKEMACTLFRPSYISLEYVLARAGVTFQYSEDITCISYLTRSVTVDGRSYVFRKINPLLWANMAGIEQRDNIAMATPERAFLDVMYLSAGNCYFDNLRPLSVKRVRELLPLYRSARLNERVAKMLNIKL